MRTYELVLVIKPSVKEEDRKKLIKTITSWLKDTKVAKEDDWGSKALAYPIKKELTGFYYDVILETDKSIDPDFERKLLQNDNLLRHLLVRKK